MKSALRSAIVAFLVVAAALPAAAQPGDTSLDIGVGGVNRTALLHLPAGLDPSHHYPLVIGFHGGLGNAEGYQRNSGLFAKGEAQGFIVVCPEGTAVIGNHRVWNSGSEYPVVRNVDDVAFTRALIEAVAGRASIDRKRVFATGFSNGGQMSYRLALELSGEIAAIAPMSGGRHADGETPGRPVPVLDFHGKDDSVYPLDGGLGAHSIGRNPHVPIDEVISEWIGFDHALPAAKIDRHDGWEELVHEGQTPVTLVLVDGLGHQIAGGTDDLLPGQPLVAVPDAVTMALQFFLAHPMP